MGSDVFIDGNTQGDIEDLYKEVEDYSDRLDQDFVSTIRLAFEALEDGNANECYHHLIYARDNFGGGDAEETARVFKLLNDAVYGVELSTNYAYKNISSIFESFSLFTSEVSRFNKMYSEMQDVDDSVEEFLNYVDEVRFDMVSRLNSEIGGLIDDLRDSYVY